MAAGALLIGVALLLVAFVPPLLLAIRVRRAERARREPWRALLQAFLWGAVGAAGLALLVETLLFGSPADEPAWLGLSLFAVVGAPVVEEAAKALGLLGIRDLDPEPEDGLIYGAMAGLGFAATENAFYVGGAFLLGGTELAIVTAVYRTLATVALHAAATAISGYGIWASRFHTVQGSWIGALLLAMLLHGAYNALAGLDALWAMVAALLLALFAFHRMLRRIRRLDARAT